MPPEPKRRRPKPETRAGSASSGGSGDPAVLGEENLTSGQGEGEPRENEGLYRALVENALNLVLVIGAGAVRYASPSVEWVLGYQAEEFVGIGLNEHIHPEDLDPAMSTIFEVANSPGVTKESLVRFRHKGGSWRYMEGIVINLLDDPNVSGVVMNIRDITAHVQAEEELRHLRENLERRVAERTAQLEAVVADLKESEERFRVTFEGAAVGIANVAPNGRWLRVNDKLCEIVGYTREELLSLTFQDITHPEDLDTDLEHVRRMLEGSIQTYTMEKRYIRKDRSRIWVNLIVSLMRRPLGEPGYFVSVIEDITERKLARLFPDPLTPRELEVLRLMALGQTNRQISRNLKYSVATAKLDARRIIAKLGVPDRLQAADRAIEIGLLPPL